MRNKIFLFMILVLCGARTTVQAQRLAVKTNLLSDAVMAPSLGAELVINDRWSLDVSEAVTKWMLVEKDLKFAYIQPEIRYWYAGRAMTRGYIGLALSGAKIKGKFRHNWYDGTLIGAGMTFGYVFHLTSHFDLEGSVGSGMYRFHRKFSRNSKADCEAADYENKRVFLPAKISLSLVYIIK